MYVASHNVKTVVWQNEPHMAYMKGGNCDVLGKGTMLTLANVTFKCTNSENRKWCRLQGHRLPLISTVKWNEKSAFIKNPNPSNVCISETRPFIYLECFGFSIICAVSLIKVTLKWCCSSLLNKPVLVKADVSLSEETGNFPLLQLNNVLWRKKKRVTNFSLTNYGGWHTFTAFHQSGWVMYSQVLKADCAKAVAHSFSIFYREILRPLCHSTHLTALICSSLSHSRH